MKILIHPKNKHLIDTLKSQATKKMHGMGVVPISSDGFDIIFCESAPEKMKSGRWIQVDKHRFVSYDTKNPSDWEIYFGFVKEEMVPAFTFIDERSCVFSSKDGFYKIRKAL